MDRTIVLALGVILLLGATHGLASGERESAGHERGEARPFALVYNGPVSAQDCPEAAAAIARGAGLAVRFTADPAELPRLLPGAAVLIIGGTEDELAPLMKAFTRTVTAALKEYLRRGGRFLGICGGGFLASTGWNEDGTHVKGLGIVPAETRVFQDSFASRILPVRWSGTSVPMFFKAGPAFRLARGAGDVRVVATYADGSIAALTCPYGEGRVAVCGPHPEARRSWVEGVTGGESWRPSTDLAVAFLKDLLAKDAR